MDTRKAARLRRAGKTRARIRRATTNRLCVFRSPQHVYAQIIDDKAGKTLVAESTMSAAFREKMKNGGNTKAATLVGNLIGEKAVQQGIKEVCYDRNGFIYAGRIKALADGVREKGVKF